MSPFIQWMKDQGQDVMPGVENSWDGPLSQWTKIDALFYTQMNRPEIHDSTIIQAGFSFWKAGSRCNRLIEEWMSLCSQRSLISDDASVCGLAELPNFCENRHDQSLLTICCLKQGIRGLHFSRERPSYDSGDPSTLSLHMFGDVRNTRYFAGIIFGYLASIFQFFECRLRKQIQFGPRSTEKQN